MTTSMKDRLQLDGKVALVTGGAGGIGQAIAQSLVDLGAKVVLTDVNKDVADVAATFGSNVDWLVADVTDSAAVDQLITETVNRHGRLDVLVANAGISYQSTTAEHEDAIWRKVMSINLDGTFYAMRAAGRQMLKQEGGTIIGISSICAVTSARPELHIGYDASKAAVARMCRNLAVEWAKSGIRVNAVAPAYTKTKMLQASGDSQPGFMAQWLSDMPVGRLMETREVADTVAFLATEAASGITGVELMVDGGYSV